MTLVLPESYQLIKLSGCELCMNVDCRGCKSFYHQHILETEQQCRRDSGLEIHSLDLGLDKVDPVSAAPPFLLSVSVGQGEGSIRIGGPQLPVLFWLGNQFILTRERKTKLRLNGGHKPAFSEGATHGDLSLSSAS